MEWLILSMECANKAESRHHSEAFPLRRVNEAIIREEIEEIENDLENMISHKPRVIKNKMKRGFSKEQNAAKNVPENKI